jgi:BlaI family transcriptional regulator, penicillinase repressor
MARKGRNVTDYELAVIEVLWGRGQATIREIAEAVYGNTATATYATVQKLLERLEKKGCVERDRASFAHVFRPKIRRTDVIGQELESLADKLCGGSLTPLLMHLAEIAKLSQQDRKMLRRLIEESK